MHMENALLLSCIPAHFYFWLKNVSELFIDNFRHMQSALSLFDPSNLSPTSVPPSSLLAPFPQSRGLSLWPFHYRFILRQVALAGLEFFCSLGKCGIFSILLPWLPEELRRQAYTVRSGSECGCLRPATPPALSLYHRASQYHAVEGHPEGGSACGAVLQDRLRALRSGLPAILLFAALDCFQSVKATLQPVETTLSEWNQHLACGTWQLLSLCSGPKWGNLLLSVQRQSTRPFHQSVLKGYIEFKIVNAYTF